MPAAGFWRPVYPGDTLSTVSEVIGKKENSNGKTGVVYVRSTGYADDGTEVLDYVRWVMVKKRDAASPPPDAVVPDLPAAIDPQALGNAVPLLDTVHWENDLSGSPFHWADYEVGEKIDHVDGMTAEEAEHQMATRLYQNTAKVHFNLHTEAESRFGKRLIYGGHVISLARALVLQRSCQCFPCRRDQWRPPCGPALCRRHRLCLVGSSGKGRDRWPVGRCGPAAAARRHEKPRLCRFPAEGCRRQVRRWRHSRLRLLGINAEITG
jgi:acyl dehydratase